MSRTLPIVVLAALASGAAAQEAPRPAPAKAGGDDCPQAVAVGDLPFRDTGDTCPFTDTLDAYAGGCTLQGVGYPGPDTVYAITLTEGNAVGFRLDLDGSAGDLALVLVADCGDGASCVINSPDLIGPGVGPEELPVATYPPGTYALYVDSSVPAGAPGSCGTYRLAITGRNTPAPDLAVRPRVSPEPVAGSRLTLTLEVTNDSPFLATGVTATATLPEGVSVVSAPAACRPEGARGRVCDLGDLPPFGRAAPAIVLAVGPRVRGALAIAAEVRANEDDPDPANNRATRVAEVAGRSDLSLRVAAVPEPVLAGTGLTYTLTVANAGPSTATGVQLAAALPPGTRLASGSEGCRGDAGAATCGVGDLAAGAAATRRLTVAVDPAARGTLATGFRARSAEEDPTPAAVTRTTAIRAVADLAVTVSDGRAAAAPGGAADYRVEVRNLGPAAVTGARVVDVFPPELSEVTWRCRPRSGASCDRGPRTGDLDEVVTLPAGASAVYEVSGRLPPAPFVGVLRNTAAVSLPADTADLVPSNNSATDQTTVGGSNLSITKTDGREVLNGSLSLTYEITVTNLGPEDAIGARVVDTFPIQSLVTWTCEPRGGATCPAGGFDFLDDLVSLPAGSSVIYRTFGLLPVLDVFPQDNTARVVPPPGQVDPDPSDNSATDLTTLNGSNLAVSTTDGREAAFSGDPLTYDVTVTNLGPEDAPGVTVTDEFPAAFRVVRWRCEARGGASCAPEGTGDLDERVELPAGSSVTYTVAGTLAAAFEGTLANTASAALADPSRDADPSNNSATDTTEVLREPAPGATADLAVTKDDGLAVVRPGQELTYTLVATNRGPADVRGATVSDRFPPALTCRWTCRASRDASCTAGPVDGDLEDVVDLPAGGTATYTADCVLDASASGTLVNTARISAPAGISDPDLADNAATDADAFLPPDLAVAKDNGQVVAVAGAPVTYTVTVANLGPGDVAGAAVVDELPAELVGVRWTCSASTGARCAPGLGLVRDAEPNDTLATAQDLDPERWSLAADPDVGDAQDDTSTAIPHLTVLGTGDGTFDRYAFTVAGAGLRGIFDVDFGTLGGFNSHLRVFDAGGALLASNDDAPADRGGEGSASSFDAYLEVVFPAAGVYVVEVGSCCVGPVPAGASYRLQVSIEDHPTAAVDIFDAVDLPAGGVVTYTIRGTIAGDAAGSLVNTATVAPPAGRPDPDLSNNAATDADPLVPPADLAIAKDDGREVAVPGELLTYTIAVSNFGPGDVAGASVEDVFPEGLEDCAWTCAAAPGSSCTPAGAGDLDDRADLPAGGAATYRATCRVSSAAAGALVNTATVRGPAGSFDPEPGNDAATDRDLLPADLAVVKDDGQAVAVAGVPLVYTVAVTNLGPGDAAGVAVTDALPAGLEAVGWRCAPSPSATCSPGSYVVPEVEPNPFPAPQDLDLASWSLVPDPDVGSADADTSTTIPHLTVLGTAGGSSDVDYYAFTVANAGDRGIFDVDFGSTGGLDTRLRLTDSNGVFLTSNDDAPPEAGGGGSASSFDAFLERSFPAPGTYVLEVESETLEPLGSGGTYRLQVSLENHPVTSAAVDDLVDLPAGGTATYTIAATVAPGAAGSVVNTASAATAEGQPDPEPANDRATDVDPLVPASDLAIAVDDGLAVAVPGESLTYTITVTNLGPGAAIGASVRDAFPAELEACAWTCAATAGASCAAAGDGDVDDRVNLPAGGSVVYTAACRVSAAATGAVVNTATVTAVDGYFDPDPSNDTATDRDALPADLAVTKDDGQAVAVPGVAITYTITVTNAGPGDVLGAAVLDAFPAGLAGVRWSCAPSAGARCAEEVGSGDLVDVVDLPAGGTLTYTVDATVDPAASGLLANAATVATPAGQPDTDPSNDRAVDVDPVVPPSDLAVAKDDGVEATAPGERLTYAITVTNFGPGAAIGASVRDPFPPALEDCAWTCAATAGSSCTPAGAGDVDDRVDLASGGSASYVATCTVSESALGAVVNTATVAARDGYFDPDPSNDTATDRDILPVDLAIAKDDGREVAFPGGPVTYTVTVTNAGPGDALGATVSDPFPAELAEVAWRCSPSPGARCAPGSDVVADTEPNDDLDAAQDLEKAAWSRAFDPEIGDTVANTSTVIPHLTVLGTGNGTLDRYAFKVAAAGLRGIFDVDAATFDSHLRLYDAGGALLASIDDAPEDHGEDGSTSRDDAYLEIVFPAAGTYVLEVGACCVGPVQPGRSYRLHLSIEDHPTSRVDLDDVVDLPAGGTLTYTVFATVESRASGSLVNTAKVAAPPGQLETDLADNSATDADVLGLPSDLGIAVDNGGGGALPGRPTTYTITVTNLGPGDAPDTSVRDRFPPELVDCAWTCAASPGSSCAPVGSGDVDDRVDLLAGGTAIYTATCTVSPFATGAVVNAATVAVAGGSFDPDPGNDVAVDRDVLPADLGVTKDDGATVALSGAPIFYTVTVTNSGPGDARGARVVDVLPPELRSVTWSCFPSEGGSCTAADSTLGEVEPNDTLATAQDLDPGSWSLAGNGRIGDADSNTSTTIPHLTVEGTGDGTFDYYAFTVANAGDRGIFDVDFPFFFSEFDSHLRLYDRAGELLASNNDAPATHGQGGSRSDEDAFLELTFPAAGIYVLEVASCCIEPVPSGRRYQLQVSIENHPAPGFDVDDVVDLPAGGTLRYSFAAIIDPDVTGSLVNTATVTAPPGQPDPDPSNNEATDADTLVRQSELSIEKDDGETEVSPGQTSTYTLTVTNRGPSAAIGAAVRDEFPEGLEDCAWTCAASPGSTCTPAGSGDVDDRVELLNGGAATYTATCTVALSATGAVVNTATVAAPPDFLDPALSNNTSTDFNAVVSAVAGEDPPPKAPDASAEDPRDADGLAPAEIPAISGLGMLVLVSLLALASLGLLRRR